MHWLHPHGDFIVTVTRSGDNVARRKVQVKRKDIVPTKSIVIYSFSSFEDIISFCTYAKKIFSRKKVYLEKNTMLYEYQGNYYICFKNIAGNANELKSFCSSMAEFGVYVDFPELFERKLEEYGTKIISKSVISSISKKFD